MSLKQKLENVISVLFSETCEKEEIKEVKEEMPTFVVPCTTVLPYGLYEVASIERFPFRNIIHLKNGQEFPACNFVRPRKIQIIRTNGPIRSGSTVEAYVENEAKTLRVLRFKENDRFCVFSTPSCDAYYTEK